MKRPNSQNQHQTRISWSGGTALITCSECEWTKVGFKGQITRESAQSIALQHEFQMYQYDQPTPVSEL